MSDIKEALAYMELECKRLCELRDYLILRGEGTPNLDRKIRIHQATITVLNAQVI